MGGLTSGRWAGHRRKSTIEEFGELGPLAIGATELNALLQDEASVVSARWCGIDVQLTVVPVGELTAAAFEVELVAALADGTGAGTLRAVRTHSTGIARPRWWLICSSCGKKKARLFQKPKSLAEAWHDLRHRSDTMFYWECRKCLGLCYGSEVIDPLEKFLRRKSAVLKQLGVTETTAGVRPVRPKGMHPRRYSRLLQALDELNDEYRGLLHRALHEPKSKVAS